MTKKELWLLILSLCYLRITAQISIVPYPAVLETMNGTFVMSNETKIVLVSDPLKQNEAEVNQFTSWLQFHFNINLQRKNTLKETQNVLLIYSTGQLSEKYELNIQPSKIIIKAEGAGLKNAFETLKQLTHGNNNQKAIEIPSCFILDSAQFKWRGMHLDVSRHFFDKQFIKRYIDFISMYKMNVFHWHLTDDQGWRIEIKKYPNLTATGSQRKGSMIGHYRDHLFDSISYGGFYTQSDIKEIVAYAKTKHVTIVPEIEMPGHAMAALAAYPNLACNKGPFEVATQWGVFDDVFCPKPETFDFLENVLSEVISLFPGEYIHVGGDECPKSRWKKCNNCQQLMSKENLKDEHELQSYFIQRIEKFLNKNNKKLIGWDEILEGGLAQNAAVMSWRGTEGGIAAAKQKHTVVMTPGSHCYFDHYQGNPVSEPVAIGGFTPIEKVYDFDPVPVVLNEQERSYILGAQANVWTEYLNSPASVEYAVFPRIAALSEALWTVPENKNKQRFLGNIQEHFSYLDLYQINYSNAIYGTQAIINKCENKPYYCLQLTNTMFENGVNEITDSLILTETKTAKNIHQFPFILDKSFTGYAQYTRGGKAIGKQCFISFKHHLACGMPVQFKTSPSKYYNQGNLVDGIKGEYPLNNKQWLAWNDTDMEATIDLQVSQTLANITVGFYRNEADFIYLPSKVKVYCSEDSINFNELDILPTIENNKTQYNYTFKLPNKQYRYVKLVAICATMSENGKVGSASSSWLFADEIEIN